MGPGGAYDPGAGTGWNAHPFNPRNNVNYDESVLPPATSVCETPFCSTIPSRRHIRPVLDLQKRYVDHLLAIASEYPHILISIANESRAHLDWSRFWAEYTRQRVPSGMMIGEMPSTNRKDGGGECEHDFSPLTLCTDRRYDYVDIAQSVSGHEFRNPRDQALGGGRRILEFRRAMAEAGIRRPAVSWPAPRRPQTRRAWSWTSRPDPTTESFTSADRRRDRKDRGRVAAGGLCSQQAPLRKAAFCCIVGSHDNRSNQT